MRTRLTYIQFYTFRAAFRFTYVEAFCIYNLNSSNKSSEENVDHFCFQKAENKNEIIFKDPFFNS